MNPKESFLQSADGLSLYIADWPVDNPSAVIAIVHGFGDHVNRYPHLAAYFNKAGFAFIGLDQRGHGKSGGKRGHTHGFGNYLEDVHAFLTEVDARYSGIPVFLYGHSMGGNVVLNYILKENPPIRGAIVTSPWILLAFQPPAIKIWLGKLMRSLIPAFTQPNGLRTSDLSRDPEVVSAYEKDPLVHDKVSASAGMSIMDAGADLQQFTGQFPVPLLLMHGSGDQITSFEASKQFAAHAGKNVSFVEWPGYYHEIHNEPEKVQVLNQIENWIKQHL